MKLTREKAGYGEHGGVFFSIDSNKNRSLVLGRIKRALLCLSGKGDFYFVIATAVDFENAYIFHAR